MPGKPFEPGDPRCGRKKGSVGGRTRALMELDKLLGKDQNLKHLQAKFQAAFNDDPLEFWRKYIQPNLPKDVDLAVSGGFPSAEQFADVMREAQAEAAKKAGVAGDGSDA